MSRVAAQPVLMSVFDLATAIVRYYQAFGRLDNEKTITVTDSYDALKKLSILCFACIKTI